MLDDYLMIITRKSQAVKVGDVVRLVDGTLTVAKGQTGRLLEHTGGFCESNHVIEVVHRRN